MNWITENPFLGIFFNDETAEPVKQAVNPSIIPTATPLPKDDDMKLLTHNIKNTPPDLPDSAVERAARECSGRFTVGGFQEIVEPADRQALRRGLGPDYRVTDFGSETPLAVIKQRYNFLDGAHVKVTDGRIIPRGLGYDWTQTRNLVSGLEFFQVSSHFMNLFRMEDRVLRVQQWNQQYEAIRLFIKKVGKDRPVIVFADFNKHFVKPFSPNFKWVVGTGPSVGYGSLNMGNSIDKIGIHVPPGYKIKKTSTEFAIDTPSDHTARGVGIRIERKG